MDEARPLPLLRVDLDPTAEASWDDVRQVALVARDVLDDEEERLGDAPWPPHFAKQKGEPKRVQPRKARKDPD